VLPLKTTNRKHLFKENAKKDNERPKIERNRTQYIKWINREKIVMKLKIIENGKEVYRRRNMEMEMKREKESESGLMIRV